MIDFETHLNDIKDKLSAAIKEIDLSLLAGQKDIESMQEYYWLNYTEMDEYGYENYDNQRSLFLREGENQEMRILKTRYEKMLQNPYFGRVDFVYEGEDEPEVFYIGIGNFSLKKGMAPLIYDWRAPVSSLFYDYDAGAASYDSPGGVMKGEIKNKAQYKIRNGKIVYAFESDVKIDDEVLSKELSGKGETSLKNIIQTIQKEQNVIIRNTKDRILVIQGVAGSGKTSVALHRVAYLLYHDREHLKSKNVLILSPNGIFSDYISHILPELGEENILEMSFDTFAYRELRTYVYDTEDRADYMQELLAGEDDPCDYKYKQSREFIESMEVYCMMLEDELLETHNVKIKKWEKSARDIERLFYDKFTDFPLLSRMEHVMEHVVDEYETLTGQSIDSEELDILRNDFFSMFKTTDLYRIYSEFLEREGLQGLPHMSYEKRILPYADVYPMLYMKYLLLSRKDHKLIKHLIIDEMQDYSYLQYRILGMLFNCKMTILGDKAQTIDDSPRNVMSFLPGILGRDIQFIEMNKSYRNTVEISEYARGLLSENADDTGEQFDRHGEQVDIISAVDVSEATREICSDALEHGDCDTAAVITFTQEDADGIYELLEQELLAAGYDVDNRLTLINNGSKHFRTGITVIPYYLAKGLEFERVYMLDRSECKGSLFTQARYIAATRALHYLKVITL